MSQHSPEELKFQYSNLGPLCSKCQEVFCSLIAVRTDKPEKITLRPQDLSFETRTCCFCAILYARHERFLEQTRKRGHEVELQNIIIVRTARRPNTETMFLGINYEYTKKQRFSHSLHVVPEKEVQQSASWNTDLTWSTISESSLSFLWSRLQNCLENHPKCSPNEEDNESWFPSRLLEIQEALGKIVFLRDKSQIQPFEYCSLSHCWGSLQPMRLTLSTEASLRAGISLDSLPKTFREAITICQKFHIRYIWIDSLCIRQDDLEDWQKEAATMGKVYSKAIFNLAATNAMDSSMGLAFDRNPKAICPFWVNPNWPNNDDIYGKFLVFPPYPWLEDVDNGVLNKRAWVLQERFLSPRIMHFSYTQVLWECREEHIGEVFGQSGPGWEKHFGPIYQNGGNLQHLKRVLSNPEASEGQESFEVVYDAWYKALTAYSGCGVTKEKDKFVAIQGIVRQIVRITGDRFVAGLWQSRLLKDLLWIRLGAEDTSTELLQSWVAPTWSWASNNRVVLQSGITFHSLCPPPRIRAAIEHIDVEEEESGELKHASLVLRGKFLQAAASWENFDMGVLKLVLTSRDRSEIIADSSNFFLNVNVHSFLFQQRDLKFMAIYDCKCVVVSQPTKQVVEGLVLRESVEHLGKYERFGMFQFSKRMYEFYTMYEAAEEHLLELI